MPDFSVLVESAVKNGISLIVCLLIIGIFAKILQWVFKFVDKLVTETLTNLTSAITALQKSIQTNNEAANLSLQKISQDIKDGFDRMLKMGDYQREEHEKMLDLIARSIDQSEQAREKLLNAIKEWECKAK